MQLDLFGAAERVLNRLQYRCLEPLEFAAKKRSRLDRCGAAGLDGLPAIAFDPDPPAGAGCAPGCAAFVDDECRQLRKFAFRRDGRPAAASALWRGSPTVLDLDAYPDFERYLARLRRHSKGGIVQQIRKARARGFYTKRFYRPVYRGQCFDIETSKRFRSGPVLAALLRRQRPPDFADGIGLGQIAAYLNRPVAEIAGGVEFPEPPPPPCPRHWAIDWGVFLREEVGGQNGFVYPERLVGFIFLKRIGNLVRTRGVMGHGAYLPENVMKLLLHDVIAWLLARQEPAVQGVRYLHYGAAEHGHDGLFAWKRSFEFAPGVFSRVPGEARRD